VVNRVGYAQTTKPTASSGPLSRND
jgi:hypothetical protein